MSSSIKTVLVTLLGLGAVLVVATLGGCSAGEGIEAPRDDVALEGEIPTLNHDIVGETSVSSCLAACVVDTPVGLPVDSDAAAMARGESGAADKLVGEACLKSCGQLVHAGPQSAAADATPTIDSDAYALSGANL